MNNLWYLPLENLDKRYTILMDKQLCQAFSDLDITNVRRIYGQELTQSIETGAFLDSDGTNYFKFSQLQEICKAFHNGEVKDGDVFFISDLWFPGLVSIPYMAMFHKIKVKICGIFHAGSWTTTDYVALLKKWAHHTEVGWFELVSKIFVGTQFHKDEILKNKVCSNEDKIFVTGLPFDTKDICTDNRMQICQNKKDIVVFNSRLDDEKHPEAFDYVAYKVSMVKPNVEFVKTMNLNLNKNEYFDLLARSKVIFSAADQENFGYGVLEGVALGNSIVVPNRLSYVEMYPHIFRYDSLTEATNLTLKFLDKPLDVSYIAEYYNKSAYRIVSEIKKML